MFVNISPLLPASLHVVAKVASAVYNQTTSGAVVRSDKDKNLFKVMGVSEAQTYKVNVVDLKDWLYKWVDSHLEYFGEGGWIDSDKITGFDNFDIRIEEGELFYIPWNSEDEEHVMEDAEELILLKSIEEPLPQPELTRFFAELHEALMKKHQDRYVAMQNVLRALDDLEKAKLFIASYVWEDCGDDWKSIGETIDLNFVDGDGDGPLRVMAYPVIDGNTLTHISPICLFESNQKPNPL